MVRLGITCVALLALSACADPQRVPAQAETPALSRSASAGPGSKSVPASQALKYFTSLCGQIGNGRPSVEAAAAANGFVQNTKTTTYYHSQNNLSVKLADQNCSIVFVSKDDPSAVRSEFASPNSTLGAISFRDRGVLGGEHYYSARK